MGHTDCIATIANQDFISDFDKKYMENYIYKKIDNLGLATLVNGFAKVSDDSQNGILFISHNVANENIGNWIKSISDLVVGFYTKSLE